MRRLVRNWFLVTGLLVMPAIAEQRAIVRVNGDQSLLGSVCRLLGCNVIRGLGDPLGQVFLVGIPDTSSLTAFLNSLSLLSVILDAEPDASVRVAQDMPPIPAALFDTGSVSYFGVQVRSGYISQPA